MPNICSEEWMQSQTYASDGIPGQVIGEDTEDTVTEARMKNAGRDAYCKRKKPH